MKLCTITNCNIETTPDAAKGYCSKHYQRLRKNGGVDVVKLSRHSLSNSPTHRSWMNMNKRCRNPSSNRWHIYGGRGITICERWSGVHGFDNFYQDMGTRPKNTSLDRINPNGNYEPENCRWATPVEQRYNQRIPVKQKELA